MVELKVTGVQAGQSTTDAKDVQPKRVQQSQQIIIKFADLPENMRTKKARNFYDKDGSGFLESKNANGQNEVALMQQAFGLDLSQYKSNFTSVDIDKYSLYKTGKIDETVAYYIKEKKDRILVRDYTKGDSTYKTLCYDIDYNLFAESIRASGNSQVKSCKRYFKNGNTIQSDDGYVYNLRDKKGNLIATEISNHDGSYYLSVIKRDALTSGKNVLTSETIYYKDKWYKDSESPLSEIDDFPENTNVTIDTSFKQAPQIEYKLNGKPVQAKPIGKGRYEVTDKDGNVFYLSHDGKKLKPEYVRNNP